MMLSGLLPKVEQRYALAGTLFGTLLPVLCLVVDAVAGSTDAQGVFGHSMPAAMALGLMPVFFGVGFYWIGRSRAQLLDQLSRQRQMEAWLQHQAWHDRLTGLQNRLRLEQDVEDIGRAGLERPALLLLDLDRFKQVNDSLGHDTGDALLAAIADRLRGALSGSAKLYRFGGDEFVLIVPGNPSEGKVSAVCQTICDLFQDPFELPANRIASGCSIGATFFMPGEGAMGDLLKRADRALYEAKARPGNSFRLFDAALEADVAARSAIEGDLTRALADGELYLEYQPIIGVESGAVRAFEAVLRWTHPTQGILPPELFLPVAKRAGLIVPLGQAVMREACLEAARWPAPTGIAINVCAEQITARGFLDHIAACLDEAGLAPGRLTLEVTEAAFAEDEDEVCLCLQALREQGVRVVLDGFGVGVSAINTLRALPIDQLKIDPSLVSAMMQTSTAADLVGIILKLGEAFGIETAVEGVETQMQLAFIREHGACEAQGNLVSPPVSADAVMAVLTRRQVRRSA